MAYIGRDTDKLSNIEVLDVITFDGSSSYTLQKNSVNFTPSSANNVLVSIDGVVQANNFTVSGSTIDFGVAVSGTSTCDWIYHIGVGLITTPADGTVTTAKLADASVTSAKLDSGIALGKVLQVVTATDSTERTTTSSSFVTASNTLTVDITPSSTSNKVLILCSTVILNNTGGAHVAGTIYRDSTNLGSTNGGLTNSTSVSGITGIYQHAGISLLDSPASTSSLTYQFYIRTNGTGIASINANPFGAGNTPIGSITAMEIAG
jgi:hypothetical protein